MSNSEEMRKIMNLLESNQTLDISFNELEDQLLNITDAVAKRWQSIASIETKPNPYAQNTGRPVSPGYSMVRARTNIAVHEGQFSRNCFAFLQIGSNISSSDENNIIEDYVAAIEEQLNMTVSWQQPITNVTSDGVRVYCVRSYGSAWGGVGFYTE